MRKDFPYCLHCGTLRKKAKIIDYDAPILRSPHDGGPRFDIVAEHTAIGRDAGNDVVLDDPSVSRRHAEVHRDPGGFRIRDLGSFNGTAVDGRPTPPEGTLLHDGATVQLGDIDLLFEQPRSVEIGSRTFAVTSQQTRLAVAAEQQAATATEPLDTRTRRRSGWALKQIPDDRGRRQWVLRNTRTGQYLQMEERDRFLWDHIDGEATIRDLLFAYAQEYGDLALGRIERTLRAFDQLGLLRGLSDSVAVQRLPWWRRAGRRVLSALTKLEVSIGGIDGLFERLYNAGGWRLFTRTSVMLLWLVVLGGAVEFWKAKRHHRLFDIGGAGVWGAVVLGVIYLAALALHESAHALAVKSYGRKVTRGGFMMMMGMPFAFVDTSDMWFGSRWSRVVVTLSGPVSTAAVAGACATVSAEVANPVVAGMAFQLAIGLYLNTLYNFNPLMPLDGYQALADSLRVPRLREEAMAYAYRGVWLDVRNRHRPGLREIGLVLYGAGAVACTYLFLWLGIKSWNGRLGGTVDRHLHSPYNVLVVIAAIGLVMFPVWYRFARKLRTVAVSLWRRARPRQSILAVDESEVFA